jgi:hypothetical protein
MAYENGQPLCRALAQTVRNLYRYSSELANESRSQFSGEERKDISKVMTGRLEEHKHRLWQMLSCISVVLLLCGCNG